MVYKVVPLAVNSISRFVVARTSVFVSKKRGLVILRSLILLGPIFYLPTLWEVWTATNIDAFRTVTWPFLLSGQVSSFVLLSHEPESDWGVKLCILAWIIMTILVMMAVFCR